LLGIATIIIGAAGVFVQLQKSSQPIWEVKASTSKSGIWILIKTRLFSFGPIMSIAFLLLVSLVLSSLLSALGSWTISRLSESLFIVFKDLNFIFSLAITTVLFVFMFKILPDASIEWNLVCAGALYTAFLFVIGKTVLGLYFGQVNPELGYGSVGSVIFILLWTSYSLMIVFFGAEFTKIYADYNGGKIPDSKKYVNKK
jgi:membrane protein